MSNVSILGIPYDASSTFMRGPAGGPDSLRKALHGGSTNYWTESGLDLSSILKNNDLGNLVMVSEDPQEVMKQIEEKVTDVLSAGQKTLTIGGDHFITYPIIRAYAKMFPNLHILQFDAHGDLYHDFEGNRFSHASPFARIMEEGLAASLTQIGIRTLNDHQKQQASKFGVTIIEMKNFNSGDPLVLKGPLYISMDLDALDPAYAPGVSHHEPGGFTAREVLEIIQNLDVPIIGADIVELNPVRDIVGITAMLAAKLMKELLVKMLESDL